MPVPLSRRSLLIGAGLLGLTACAKPPITIVRPTAKLSGDVRAQLTRMGNAYLPNSSALGISVLDLRTSKRWNLQGDVAAPVGSVASVLTAALALHSARSEHREPSFETYTQISQATIESKAEPLRDLWTASGGVEAYRRFAASLGLTNTTASEAPSTVLSSTNDQVTLLEKLVQPNERLNREDCLYLLDVLHKAPKDQSWALGQQRSKQVAVRFKNGWMQESNAAWTVNSMGWVEGAERTYLAAMTCRVATLETGKALLDAVSADLFTILGFGRLEA